MGYSPMQPTNVTLVVDPHAESGGIETLPPTNGLEIVDRATFAEVSTPLDASAPICINSEAALDDVLSRLDDNRAAGIRALKDKTAFRKLLAPLFPEFHFDEIPMDQLATASLNPNGRFVVKPALGCFGTGVRVIEGTADLAAVQAEIVDEVRRNSEVLSADVLSADTLIIEQYIEGEEYAIDMYFDGSGNPHITNIYHHPMPGNPAYLHMVYYSSRQVLEMIFDDGMAFLRGLNSVLGLTNVPLHCEFRRDSGHLVPIEINAMRFGGMGLANLGWFSHQSNAYQHFVNGTSPDWATALAADDDASVFFIAYNGTDVDVDAMTPNWDGLLSQFTSVLHTQEFDHRQQLAFGIVYAREPTAHIPQLLNIEFNDYFVAS